MSEIFCFWIFQENVIIIFKTVHFSQTIQEKDNKIFLSYVHKNHAYNTTLNAMNFKTIQPILIRLYVNVCDLVQLKI